MALSRILGDDFFFGGLAPSLLTSDQAPSAALIAMDVIEMPDFFTVTANLPGVVEEDICLCTVGDVLSLSVDNQDKDKKETEGEDKGKVHRNERTNNFARRNIRLPESADTEKIKADVKDGVLQVNIPKKQEAAEEKRIPVGSGGQGDKK